MRTIALGAISAILALAGCGGDDETTAETTEATGASGASGAAGVGDTVGADEVASCLVEAGQDAAAVDTETLGLDVEHERVDVAISDLDQGAVILVFDTPETATATEQAAGIAAGVSDATAAGNTVWGIDAAAQDPADAEAAIEGCLPGS